MVETTMGMGKDTFLHGIDSRRRERGANAAAAEPAAPLPANLPPEIQLEFERLRAERDALAAELQEERAERLHAEERLHMLEREKLEQMRQGAASREKLASELEEARLRAMRAEARQAALDADLRLAEIGTRRRNLAEAEAEDQARKAFPEDVADGGAEASAAPEPPEPRATVQPPPTPPPRERRSTLSTARRLHAEAPPARERPASQPSPVLSRYADPASPQAQAATTAKAGGGKNGTAGRGARAGGGEARAGIDRAQLESRLVSGAVIRTTERFRQFQPVAPAHLKVCDWLAQVETYGELQAKAEGQLPASTVLDVLVLFLDRSFISVEPG